MKAKTLIAASALAASAAVFAGEQPAAPAATTTVTATAAAAVVQAAPAPAAAGRTRADVKAEAIEAVRNHKTTLARQLVHYK